MSRPIAGLTALALLATAPVHAAPPAAPPAFDVTGHATILTLHAEGAQIYQCEPDPSGALAWSFREPIATLIADGKTVGRHFAGPNWELDDSSAVKGKLIASAPGEGPGDIPLLKLTVAEHRGAGALAGANLVLRLNTHGGAFKGACSVAGAFHAESYSADYVFLR